MLVAALVVLLAVFGFVKIAEELGEGELAKLDEWLLLLFRAPGQPHVPIGPPWLVEVAQDITVLGGRTMLLAVTLFPLARHLPGTPQERALRPQRLMRHAFRVFIGLMDPRGIVAA